MSENVGASTFRNPKGFHGLNRDDFTFFFFFTLLKITGILHFFHRPVFWKLENNISETGSVSVLR
jgi:hypothetical protein